MNIRGEPQRALCLSACPKWNFGLRAARAHLNAQLNGHRNKSDASPAKIELSEYILKQCGVRDVFKNTAIRGKFTIWHRELR